MWIVCGSGSRAVAAPVAETRVRELVRGFLRCIRTDVNALASGFPLFLSWFERHSTTSRWLRASSWESPWSHPSSVLISSSDSSSSIAFGLVLTCGPQITVQDTAVPSQFKPGKLCELVQNHACSCTCSIYDHAALVLCMSDLNVRTCE